MENKEAYTPAEIARMLEVHTTVDGTLRAWEESMAHYVETVRALKKDGEHLAYCARHTNGKRLQSGATELRSWYEAEIPENVRDAFRSARILPDLKVNF